MIKRYSAQINQLKVQKLYKNDKKDLQTIFLKLVCFAERCKSMIITNKSIFYIFQYSTYIHAFLENNRVTVPTFPDAINNLEGLYLEIKVLHRKVSKDAGSVYTKNDVSVCEISYSIKMII